MLKKNLQNREGDVCCQPKSHSHQKIIQILLILLFGTSLLIGTTVSPAEEIAVGPPEIIDFESTPGYQDAWTFDGSVDGENPETMTIDFGGLLDGHSTTPYTDGSFSYSVVLTDVGIVTAVATNELGDVSEEVEVFVEDF